VKKKLGLLVLAVLLALTTCVQAVEKFSDVPDDHWAARSIYNVVRLGVTRGYPDGTFRGNLTINRYELMVFLSNLAISLEQMMDQKLNGTAPIGTPNAGTAINDRALEELRAEIETLKAAVLRGEKTVFEPKRTTGKEGPWKIAGGFEFRGQNQTLSTSGTSVTNIMPRFNLGLTGNFGRSGFLLDVDTDYQNVNTNGLFKNITSNVLAVKGWGKLPLSDQGYLLIEGSAGPADYRISDSYQYGSSSTRQRVVYRPGNAIRGELNISGFILSNQFEKRVSANGGVDRNLTTIGYAFDKDQKNIISLGLDQYSGIAAQNQRLVLNLGFAFSNEVAMSGRFMTESPAANQTETFYEMKLKFKAVMTEIELQVAQLSPGFSNSGPFEIAATNVYQYEVLPGTNEMGFIVKQKFGEIMFARLGYSNSYAYNPTVGIDRASQIAGLGLGADFDAFSTFAVDYLSVDSRQAGSAYSNIINASFLIKF